jgi:hypothetical protein
VVDALHFDVRVMSDMLRSAYASALAAIFDWPYARSRPSRRRARGRRAQSLLQVADTVPAPTGRQPASSPLTFL